MSTDPITDIIFVSNPQARPSGYFILEKTVQGHDAQMYEASWRSKSKRFLCFSKDSKQSSKVIIELTVITEDSKVPTGFAAISTAKDDNEKALRKHLLCVKTMPRDQVMGAICDVVLINRAKGEPPPPGYFTVSHSVNDLYVCYRTGSVAHHQTPPAGHQYSYASPPHPVGAGYRPQVPAYPQQQQQWFGYQQQPAPHMARPQQQIPVTAASPTSPTDPHKISILDGVPFEISPKFSLLWKKGETSLAPAIKRLSIGDVGSKYDYSFHSERAIVGSR